MLRPDETLDTWAGISGICIALMVLLLVITEQRRREHRRHQTEQAEADVHTNRARTEHLINRVAHAAADPIDRELMHLSGQCGTSCDQPYDQEKTA